MKGAFPLITAHSGCMGSEPNSREHLQLAVGLGADVVEVDVRLSADGHVVLSHEAEITLPGYGHARIRDLEWGRIAASRDGGALPLQLDEAFDFLEGEDIVVNLDAKESEAAIAAALIAERRGWKDSVVFSGLGPAEARLMRDRMPGFRYLLNADAILPSTGYGSDRIVTACRMVVEYGCCGLNLDWRAAGDELMKYAKRRCIPVMLWTVDTEEDIRHVLSLSPYSLTTNRPDILIQLCA